MRVIAERAARGSCRSTCASWSAIKPSAEGLAGGGGDEHRDARRWHRASSPIAPSYDAALVQLLAQYQPKLIVLAGFMRILTPHFIGAFAGRILNVHPSLLPKYRGLHTHRRALEAGEALHGVSVHFVTEELDGGPVVLQAEVPVLPGDSETTLSARVQQGEHRIYPQAIDWFARGRLLLKDGRAWLDGKPLDAPLREPSQAAGG